MSVTFMLKTGFPNFEVITLLSKLLRVYGMLWRCSESFCTCTAVNLFEI